MNAGAGNGAANGAANGSNLRANANAWYPPAGRNPYEEPYYPPTFNANRPTEQLEEAAEMDALLEENMSNNTREMNNLLREINAGRAANMPQRKNRKASRKGSRKGSRKVSRKGSRKASRKNRKSRR